MGLELLIDDQGQGAMISAHWAQGSGSEAHGSNGRLGRAWA